MEEPPFGARDVPRDADAMYEGALVPGRFGGLRIDAESDDRHLFRVLGYDSDGKAVVVRDEDRGRHMYVCGTTGAGKTRFMASLLLQDIHYGRPVCVLDGAGHLYDYARHYVARCHQNLMVNYPRLSEDEVGRILGRYLFLDMADDANPLRVNPFVPQSGDTVESVVDDFMRTIERETGNYLTQRVIFTVLGAGARIAAELNQLPEGSGRPELPGGHSYPVGLPFLSAFFRLDDKSRVRIVEGIPPSLGNEEARAYWLEEFPRLTRSQQNDEVGSSRRILRFLLNEVGRRFFATGTNTLDLYSVVANDCSLFCRLPQSLSKSTISLVGSYLANKVERVAYRRGERRGIDWTEPYTLVMDEFQLFCNPALAEFFTQARRYGLRIVCAHQSVSQQPFDREEGAAMLRTVVGMSRIKVVLQVDSRTADQLVGDVLPVTHQVEKRHETEHRLTLGESESVASGTTDGRSDTSQESITFGKADARSFTYPFAGVVHDTRTVGSTTQQQTQSARGTAVSHGTTRSTTSGNQRSTTTVERVVYYTGEEERVVNRQTLQTLGVQHAVVCRKPLTGIPVATPYIPEAEQLCPWSYNRADALMELQRERIGAPSSDSRLPLPATSHSRRQAEKTAPPDADLPSQLELPMAEDDDGFGP